MAERGELASLAEIAEAAGVGRAALYRYFPSRGALLTGLAQAAFEEVCERIADAQLDNAEVREGIARLARGFVAAGSKYVALIRTGFAWLGELPPRVPPIEWVESLETEQPSPPSRQRFDFGPDGVPRLG